MSHQNKNILCKCKKYDISLNCQQISRNIYKILKGLSDVNFLYLSSDIDIKDIYDDKGKEKYVHTFTLNSHMAKSIIWRSCYITKTLGIAQEQYRHLHTSKFVGPENNIDHLIDKLK